MDKIKFSDGTKLPLHHISSTPTQLAFSVLDDARDGLEEICLDAEKTSVIQYLSVNEDTLDETVLKGYAGYTKLVSMKTEYGVITNIDYDTVDKTTESGFAEESHNVTTVVLIKPAKTDSGLEQIKEIKEALALQDGAIEELAATVSDISEGQELQSGAIDDLAEVVSGISEGQALQDGAIEELAEVVSGITEE